MLSALAGSARRLREAAGLRQIDIATAAGVSHATISNFERAKSWPQDVDRIVNAYCDECGVKVHDLWKRAADALH